MSSARLGRPPRVTRAQIAEAALEIGLDRATIRSVAAHLGMSVPGLYHHVGTREELLTLAATHGLGELHLPDDVGQPLAEWLTAYARFVHDALVAQPELIAQIMGSTVDTTREPLHLAGIADVFTRRGRAPADALRAYGLLMTVTIGAAASTVGRANAPHAGAHLPDPFESVLVVVEHLAAG